VDIHDVRTADSSSEIGIMACENTLDLRYTGRASLEDNQKRHAAKCGYIVG